MTTNQCHCGRPSPTAFLCGTCTGQLEQAIATLGSLIPELGITASRQDRTSSTTRATQPVIETQPATVHAVPAQLRTSTGTIALTATPDPISHHATALLAETRNELVTTLRHLCESRGADYRDIIGRAA